MGSTILVVISPDGKSTGACWGIFDSPSKLRAILENNGWVRTLKGTPHDLILYQGKRGLEFWYFSDGEENITAVILDVRSREKFREKMRPRKDLPKIASKQ